jgi:hypothetical protein
LVSSSFLPQRSTSASSSATSTWPRHHHIYELFAAIVVNLIATVLKFGDRTQIGAVHLSTSLVADLQLVAAACVWAYRGACDRRRDVTRCRHQRRFAERRRPVGEHRFGRPADRRNGDVAALSKARQNERQRLLSRALRRLRVPLIVLIVIYAVSTLGLTLIPGVDAQGQPAPPMSFFHAFYFVSYTASTIGFGELPVAFSEAQRMWGTVIIFLSVIGWSYAIISLLSLVQDKGFQQVLLTARFVRQVRQLGEPFYIICGCGETGLLIARALDREGLRIVAIERNEARIQELELEDFAADILTLCADAAQPQQLLMAGLRAPQLSWRAGDHR